ncbi:MAG: hypothetical protein DRJ41_01420, partial [Thermoprotei archaeon]
IKEVFSFPVRFSEGKNTREFIAAYCAKRIRDKEIYGDEIKTRAYRSLANMALKSQDDKAIPLIDIFTLAKLVEGR